MKYFVVYRYKTNEGESICNAIFEMANKMSFDLINEINERLKKHFE
jgi:hypothetical protein